MYFEIFWQTATIFCNRVVLHFHLNGTFCGYHRLFHRCLDSWRLFFKFFVCFYYKPFFFFFVDTLIIDLKRYHFFCNTMAESNYLFEDECFELGRASETGGKQTFMCFKWKNLFELSLKLKITYSWNLKSSLKMFPYSIFFSAHLKCW